MTIAVDLGRKATKQTNKQTIRIYVFSGNCYSKVREETEAMRAAMGDDEYNYNHPRTEVAYIYNDDDRQSPMYKGRKIVEMKKKRPEWFSPHLKTKV